MGEWGWEGFGIEVVRVWKKTDLGDKGLGGELGRMILVERDLEKGSGRGRDLSFSHKNCTPTSAWTMRWRAQRETKMKAMYWQLTTVKQPPKTNKEQFNPHLLERDAGHILSRRGEGERGE